MRDTKSVVEDTHEPWSASGDRPTALLAVAIRRLSADSRVYIWVFDVALVVVVCLAVITHDELWFHVIFVLLIIGALMFPFRKFVIRLLVGMSISSALVVWVAAPLSTPSEELTKLPFFTFALLLVSLVTQSRSKATADREAADRELNLESEQELDTLRQQAEHTQRLELLGRTNAGLAHDLRNVFAVVRGCADDFHDSHERGAKIAAVDIQLASERGLEIIDDLLWIGKQHRHDAAEVDLHSSVTHMAPILRRLTRRGVVVSVEVAQDVTGVSVDMITVSQILMNLVSNANDAITQPTGHVRVSAKVVATKSPDSGVEFAGVIVVNDDGPGFHESALHEAFDSGFTTKGSNHSGLGLATVRQLADRFGGTVEVESWEDNGTTVRVSLPVHRSLYADESLATEDIDRSVPLATNVALRP